MAKSKSKTNTKWTNREVEYLKRNTHLTIAALARNMNRTESSVASKKYALKGVDVPETKNAKWSQNEIDYLAAHIDDSNEELIPFLKRTPKNINAMRYNIKRGNVRFNKFGEDKPTRSEARKPAKVEQKALSEYKAGDIIPAADALIMIDKLGKTPYLLFRDSNAITFLPEGEKDLDDLEQSGQLKIGDQVFEIKKKYTIGIKKV